MKYKDEQSFAASYKKGAEYGAYLLYGSETYLIEQWAKTLAGGDDSPFNSQRFDGRSPNWDALWDAAAALPFLAERKTVFLDNLDPAKLTAEGLETLEGILGDLPETTLLVITAKDPGFGGSAAGKKAIKLLDGAGAAVELGARASGDLVKFLKSRAAGADCTLSTDLARYLVDICPNDMHTLGREMDKICAYAGGGEITRAHIDGVAVPKTEARAFDLQKYILAGNAQKALELLRSLFSLREEPIAILGALSMSFCDLYRARAVRDGGGSLKTMLEGFGYKSEFRARKAFDTSARLRTGQIREAIVLLFDCDRLMKSTGVDSKIRLEQLTVSLIALCGEGR